MKKILRSIVCCILSPLAALMPFHAWGAPSFLTDDSLLVSFQGGTWKAADGVSAEFDLSEALAIEGIECSFLLESPREIDAGIANTLVIDSATFNSITQYDGGALPLCMSLSVYSTNGYQDALSAAPALCTFEVYCNGAGGMQFYTWSAIDESGSDFIDVSYTVLEEGDYEFTFALRNGEVSFYQGENLLTTATINTSFGDIGTWDMGLAAMMNSMSEEYPELFAPQELYVYSGWDSDAPGTNIPEPGTVTLSLVALAGLAARRRRR